METESSLICILYKTLQGKASLNIGALSECVILSFDFSFGITMRW